MAAPLQLSFSDYEQIKAKKKTRRQHFLDEMEITVPWESFLALIKPVYYKPSSKGGMRWSGFSGQAPSLTFEAGQHPCGGAPTDGEAFSSGVEQMPHT